METLDNLEHYECDPYICQFYRLLVPRDDLI